MRLQAAHVAVIGIGGVGSWAAEALVRHGVGRITLIDMDDVCVSNINRQVQALDGTVGQTKTSALAARLQKIHPTCSITLQDRFFTATSADELLQPGFDFVLDAIDKLTHKALLLHLCRARKIPIVSCGGAGGKFDTTRITIEDLSRTRNDALLALVRKKLRQQYNFPRERRHKFKIPCVYSDELPRPAQALATCAGDTPITGETTGLARLDCESGYGTSVSMTAIFGMHMAAYTVRALAGG